MRLLWRSIKAWLISIAALIAFFVLLFPPTSMRALEETAGMLIIAVLFLGVPLFLVILIFNAIFNRAPGPRTRREDLHERHVPGNAWRTALIGAVLAGILAAFIRGIIWEVWLVFTFVGALIGYIAGRVRR